MNESNTPAKEPFESLEDAARRLLAKMDARRKGAEQPINGSENLISPAGPALEKKRPGERMQFALKLSRPVVVIRWGAGAQTNVLRLAANGNRYDSALFWEDEAIVLDYDEW